MVESTTVTSQFRAKVAEMRAWKPENPPSNRDRLELYSLHKQAVSGDAPDPTTASVSSKASIPEKAKMNAWRNKRGLTQPEAMNQYIAECDRQMNVYGVSLASATSSPPGQQTPNNTPAQTNNTTRGGGVSGGTVGGGGGATGVGGGISSDGQGLGSGSNESMGGGNHGDNSGGSGVLLTPRGLAAVPLLCAAASESRPAYLERIAKTPKVQGWWQKQEPLCADPGTSFSMPETFLIILASKAESISLLLNDMEDNFIIPASVIQSFLWPLHNVLLAIWIALIFICTLIDSATISLKTMILGANTTRVTLDTIFSEEILPGAKTAASLCEPHQAVPVRLVGLSLMPFVSICNVCYGVVNNIGIFPGSVLYVFTLIMTWFYWLTVLPWLAFAGLTISITSGWCFALIEMAGADIQH